VQHQGCHLFTIPESHYEGCHLLTVPESHSPTQCNMKHDEASAVASFRVKLYLHSRLPTGNGLVLLSIEFKSRSFCAPFPNKVGQANSARFY